MAKGRTCEASMSGTARTGIKPVLFLGPRVALEQLESKYRGVSALIGSQQGHFTS